MANGNLMEGWLPLRSVLVILTVAVSVATGVWKVSNNVDHQFYDMNARLTSIENVIGAGRLTRDQQIKSLQDRTTAIEESVAATKEVDRLQGGDLTSFAATLVNFKRRFDTLVCQHWPPNCVNEP